MSISFSPGQAAQPTGTQAPVVPAEPVVPAIALNGPAAAVVRQSPFAFQNRSKSKFGLYFQLVVFFVFGMNVIAAVGLFVYSQVLSAEVESKKQELAARQSGFKKLPLEDMQKLSDRIAAVNQALKERASVRNALSILEYGIENSVTYTKFDLSYNESKKNYSISFSATAPNYHAVIQQVETLKNKVHAQYFSQINVGKVALDEKLGVVNFTVDASVSLQGLLPFETFQVEKVVTKASSTLKTASVASTSEIISPVASSPVAPISQ